MSLVFAAITPHPPLLIPAIGKDEIQKVEKTKSALMALEKDLYIRKPSTIIIISPHSGLFSDAFVVNGHNHFTSSFDTFGDFSTIKEWKGAPALGAQISHHARLKGVPVRLISQEKIDHGASIPLFYLTEHLPNVKILPIGYSEMSPKEHLAFGEVLKDVTMSTHERIALVASGDMAHTLATDSPAGFHKAGADFDSKIIELLETRNTAGIVGLDEGMVRDAEQCSYRSILIALGVLKNMNYTFKNLCYEAPFGVGYLTGEFVV